MTYEYQNYIIRTTFCPFRTVTKSCPVETVPACPVQIRAHRHIAVYIDSNKLRTNCHLLCLAKNLLPVDCLCTVYLSHIYTHLNYNLVVWGSMISKSQLSEIFQLQKNCIRLLAKGKNKSVDDLFATLKVIKFPDMIQSELCKFGAKV